MHAKTLDYAKLADTEQGQKETPGKFLDRLQEALCKFTDIDPESAEGGMILKDRFLTFSAPDIHCKLLKQVFRPNQSLEKLLQMAQTDIMVENMRKKIGKKNQAKD